MKTRLAAAVGFEEAARIYQLLAEHVFTRLPAGVDPLVFFDPPGRGEEIEAWVSPLLSSRPCFSPQAAGDLGARLEDAFSKAFAAGYDQLVVVGSDCVELDADVFENAFEKLADCDVVIGPSEDGGYYLLGLTSPQPSLFTDIPWSTGETLARTLDRAESRELRVALLETLRDVDDLEGWKSAKTLLERNSSGS